MRKKGLGTKEPKKRGIFVKISEIIVLCPYCGWNKEMKTIQEKTRCPKCKRLFSVPEFIITTVKDDRRERYTQGGSQAVSIPMRTYNLLKMLREYMNGKYRRNYKLWELMDEAIKLLVEKEIGRRIML